MPSFHESSAGESKPAPTGNIVHDPIFMKYIYNVLVNFASTAGRPLAISVGVYTLLFRENILRFLSNIILFYGKNILESLKCFFFFLDGYGPSGAACGGA
jgi:hypothetical protein